MSDCIRCNERADYCVKCVRRWEREDEVTIADLKARLRAARSVFGDIPWTESRATLLSATDLRRKNWRKP